VDEAAQIVYHATNGQADIRMGAARPKNLREGIKVTLIATGLNEPLPRVEDVSDLLKDADLFPSRKRRLTGDGELVIDRNDLEIPTFIRRNLD